MVWCFSTNQHLNIGGGAGVVSHRAPGHAWQRMTQHKHHLHQWCGIQTTSSVTFDSTCEGPSSLTQRSQPSTRTAPFSLGTTSRSCCVHHKIACLVGFGWVAWRDLTPRQNYEITKIQATKKRCWKVKPKYLQRDCSWCKIWNGIYFFSLNQSCEEIKWTELISIWLKSQVYRLTLCLVGKSKNLELRLFPVFREWAARVWLKYQFDFLFRLKQ